MLGVPLSVAHGRAAFALKARGKRRGSTPPRMAETRMTINQILPRLRQYMELDGNAVGGSLHIFTDDGNCEDGHIVFCRDFAVWRGDTEGAELAAMILQLTHRQRRRLLVRC